MKDLVLQNLHQKMLLFLQVQKEFALTAGKHKLTFIKFFRKI